MAALRARYRSDKAALLAALAPVAATSQATPPSLPPSPHTLRSPRRLGHVLEQLATLAERYLCHLWQQQRLDGSGAALVAVGGFGRGELYPYSDIDVLILVPQAPERMQAQTSVPDHTPLPTPAPAPASPPAESVSDAIEAFIRQCWDMGLDIGSSVRTVDECVAQSLQDVSVQTALLERRLLTGSTALLAQLGSALEATMQPEAFYRRKTLEMRQRHARFDDTPYALEPNCKESPGGLRDLHVIVWTARAAGLGQHWPDMVRHGLMTPYEARQAQRAHDFLRLIRTRLHLAAGRREDRLLFDLQTRVADMSGITASATMRAGELLMRHYYRVAKSVTQLNQVLLLNIGAHLRHMQPAPPAQLSRPLLPSPSLPQAPAAPVAVADDADNAPTLAPRAVPLPVGRTAVVQPLELAQPHAHGSFSETHGNTPCALRPINPRFHDMDGLLEVAHDQLYHQQPHAILETFLLVQSQPGIQGLSARTLRALYNARVVMDSAFRADPVNRQQFLRILQAPGGVTQALRLMNQTSVLGRYLWVFRRIVGQMQHDLFHVYTVDQHILMVLRNVRRFFTPEHAHEFPHCARLAAGFDQPWLLSVAALFHDIAKGRGGNHSTLGEQEVRRFAKTHGIGADDTDMLAFLVREHLTMSTVAQKQDISDPAVIQQFAATVGTERRLTALYLLTVADIRGTSPKVWNGWKGKLLHDLYHATLHVLGGHRPDIASVLESRQRHALRLLAQQSMHPQGHLALWGTLDAGYFMRHDAADIAWHTRHIARFAAQGKTVVRARMAPHGEGLQVVIYTPDQPELFARICGYFDNAAFSILEAKAHTTTDGYALDTFQVITSALPEHYREFITMVENALAHALHTAQPLPEAARHRPSRRARHFPLPPRVNLTPEATAHRWLLTIHASDSMGLLYRISRVLTQHGITLLMAKISTLGERVEDSFLIESPHLANAALQTRLEHDLLAAVA